MKDRKLFGSFTIEDCFAFLLFTGAFYCFVHIGISMYQTFKDIYFYTGACALMLGVLFVGRAKLFKISKILCGILAVAAILGYQVIHRNDWGPHYAMLLIAKHTMFVMLALAVWVFIEEKSWKKLRLRKDWFPFLFFAVVLITSIIDIKYMIYALIPVLVWYSVPLSREGWKKMITLFAAAGYCAFVLIMTLSLILKPNEFESGRYIGYFMFPAIAGVVAALGLLSGFWLWKTYCSRIERKALRIGSLVLILAYPLFALAFVFNRAAVVGMAVAAMLMFAVSAKKDRKVKARKRLIILAGIALAVVVTWIVTVKILQKTDLTGINEYLKEKTESGDDKGLYIVSRFIGTVSIDESRTGLFEAGTLMNALDTMSSTRVGIWYLGIKNIRFFGGSDLSVTLPNGDFAPHTHNTYLDFLLRFGIFGGGIMIVWFFAYIIMAAKRHTEYDDSVFFTMLWSFFCIMFFMLERELWTNLPAFMFLLLQYPLLMRFIDDSERNTLSGYDEDNAVKDSDKSVIRG